MAGNYITIGSVLDLPTLEQVARSGQALVDKLDNPFSAKLSATSKTQGSRIPWLITLGYNAKSAAGTMNEVSEVLKSFSSQGLTSLHELCSSDANFPFAALISEISGAAYYLAESDTCCSSTVITFEAGKVTVVDSYGEGGSEQRVTGPLNQLEIREIPIDEFDFWQCTARAFCELIEVPAQRDVDGLMDEYVAPFAKVQYECSYFAAKKRQDDPKLLPVTQHSQAPEPPKAMPPTQALKQQSFWSRFFRGS